MTVLSGHFWLTPPPAQPITRISGTPPNFHENEQTNLPDEERVVAAWGQFFKGKENISGTKNYIHERNDD